MGIKESLKGTFALLAAKAIDNNVHGKDLADKIEAELDGFLGPKTSERIQREQISKLLGEIIDGLYDGDKKQLSEFYAHKVVETANKKG